MTLNDQPLSAISLKKIHKISQADVWQHWMRVEKFSHAAFRSDIRDPLPKDMSWYCAEIEVKDLSQLFIISSDDWKDISGGTFRVVDVVADLNLRSKNPDTQRISENIRQKIQFLDSGGEFDTRLIAVTHCPELTGPFTLIEGNHRSIALGARDQLVGCRIFVGSSPAIVNYLSAWRSFSFQRRANPFTCHTAGDGGDHF